MDGAKSIGYAEDFPHPDIYEIEKSSLELATNTVCVLRNISTMGDWHWTSIVNKKVPEGFEDCLYCHGRYDVVLFAYPCMHPISCLYCYLHKLTQHTQVMMCQTCDMPFSWFAYVHKYVFVNEKTSVKLITHDKNSVNVTLFSHFPLRRHAGEDPGTVMKSNPNINNSWANVRLLAMLKWLYNDEYEYPFQPTIVFERGQIHTPLKIRIPRKLQDTKCCLYDGAFAHLPLYLEKTETICSIKRNYLKVCKLLGAYNTCIFKYNLFRNIHPIPETIRMPAHTYISIPNVDYDLNIINTLSNEIMCESDELSTVCIDIIVKRLYNVTMLDVDALRSFAPFKGRIYELFTSLISQHSYSLVTTEEAISDINCIEYDGTYGERVMECVPGDMSVVADRIRKLDDRGRCGLVDNSRNYDYHSINWTKRPLVF
ncbi:unnamed protein product [Ixodes pacificus]